jgi:lysophospholipase L1-like esterase
MRSLFLLTIFFLAGYTGWTQSKFFAADDPNFRYVGRYISNAQEIQFDWAGFYIQFSFRGSECSVKMNDTGHNYYQCFVDNKPAQTFDVKSDTTIILASGLGMQIHKIRIYKRTEGNLGKATFKGAIIGGEDKELIQWKNIPLRKIEFIGNSITCGYGTEGKSKNEPWNPSTENSYLSYATIIARTFNADYHIVAHSGQGVVRNYGDKQKTSALAMPQRYNRVFDEQPEPFWNFRQWTPNAVVINLGTNDFSTQPYPDESDFKKGYENLIAEVQKQYGEIPIFCLVGPMIDEPCYTYIKQTVDEFRSVYQKKNIYFIGIPTYLTNPEKDLGSDYHPNYSGQRKIAMQVIPLMSTILEWDFKNFDVF